MAEGLSAPNARPAASSPRRRWPIATYLMISTTGLTLVAVIMALVAGLSSAARSTNTLLTERAGHTRDALNSALDDYIRPQVTLAQRTATLVAAGRLDPANRAELARYFLGAFSAGPQLTRIALVTPDCHAFILDDDREQPREADWANRRGRCADVAWARENKGLRWLPPTWDSGLDEAVTAVEQPLHGPTGYVGYLFVVMGVSELTSFLNAVAARPGQTPFILYGRDIVVAHGGAPTPDPKGTSSHPLPRRDELGDPVMAHLWDAENDPLDPTIMRAGERGVTIHMPSGPITVIYGVRDAGTDEPWIVGTYFTGSIGAAEMRQLWMTAGVGGLILLASLGASLLVGRWLGRPVRRLAGAAEQIERENLDGFEPLAGSAVREFDDAAHAFNVMVGGLRDRQRIRDLFGRYVPVEVAKGLLAGGHATIGGENRSVSLFFSDIEDFTTLAESLPPEIVIAALNDYFEAISKVVADHGGIIVDFIGDAVFAMFGAPIAHDDHAKRALACVADLARLTADFAARRRAQGVNFGRTRFGLNTGVATIGNFGSEGRLKYSAMGDLVNSAARLEGANKAFGTTVLVSGETINQAGVVPGVVTRPIGRVVLKGRVQAIEVFEAMSAEPPWLLDYLDAYRSLVSGAADAGARFQALRRLAPDDPVSRLHADRLAEGDHSTRIILTEK